MTLFPAPDDESGDFVPTEGRHDRGNAQLIAPHESPRTTKLYHQTGNEITLDEVERTAI
jgi:hypothetical protein